MTKFKPLAVSVLCVAASVGCSGSSGGGSASSASLAAADSVDDLNLKALNLNLPESLTDNSTSLALGSPSKEACEVGRLLGDGLSNLELAASLFCHLEIESSKLKFGTKYNLEFTDGDASGIGIWIDNTNLASGQLKVSMCNNNVLSQVVTIAGLNGDAVKGSIIDRGTENSESWAGSINFDLGFTTAGTNKVYAAKEYTSGSESFKQMISINLKDTGVSQISVSEAGSWQSDTFNHAGSAKVGSSYGQVLFTSVSGLYDPWTRRAYFDTDGNVVNSDITADFASGGSLYIANSDVPAALSSSFSAENFAADAWDCATDETVTIDMSGANGAAHDACEDDKNDFYTDCSSGYDEGETEVTFDDNARVDADDLNDMD
jgi:hypothetical protein